ncbi:hypothetical protein E2562_030725 [Oryza meyeriana var. granulata]|uniref:Uncharacterized protein n=1 Tax=Oryza meyeriana var. granulata TaxID=110450 RepID=A0A6G1E4L9_9ORYZ|nr:hypothetical protein E2562_030725 [Oryza meyeriana var. granulata]
MLTASGGTQAAWRWRLVSGRRRRPGGWSGVDDGVDDKQRGGPWRKAGAYRWQHETTAAANR